MEIDLQATLDSPLGRMGVKTTEDTLTHLFFLNQHTPILKPKTYIAKETVVQLQCFFADPFFQFDLPMDLKGTDFQKKLWQQLKAIPVGQTVSYGELAEQLKSSARAVGNACRVNPIPIIIPCHRIVAKDGIGGYAGDTQGTRINQKKWLIAHESSAVQVKAKPVVRKPEPIFV